MTLQRPIIDGDFKRQEQEQMRFSTFLSRKGPLARRLPVGEQQAIWRAMRDNNALRTFQSSGLQRFNHNHGRLPDGRALLVFQGEPLDLNPSLLFLAWGSEFGTSFRAIVKLKLGLRQAAILLDDPAFDGFWSGRVVLAFMRLGKIDKAFELDYTAQADYAEALAYLLALAEDGSDKILQAAKAFSSRDLTLACSWSTIFSREWSRSDWLQHGWVLTVKKIIPRMRRIMPSLAADCAVVLTRTDLEPYRHLKRALEIVVSTSTAEAQITSLLAWFGQSRNGGCFISESIQFFDLRENAGEEMGKRTVMAMRGLTELFYILELMPDVSRFGRRQAYLDGRSYEIEGYDLDPGTFNIETGQAAEQYWTSKSFKMPYDAPLYLDPGDFPANPDEIRLGLATQTVDIDVVSAKETAGHLLDEAIALKKWTIPPRARVEIAIGPFVAVELTEVYNEVYFIWRTKDDHYWPASIGVRTHECLIPDVGDAREGKAIEACLLVLMAALVRDFWVAEERHKVFDVTRHICARNGSKKPAKRIVYLPRIRYDAAGASLRAGISKVSEGLNQLVRSRHFVKFFFRKVDKPSPLQLALAQRQKITVPEGHTFVKSHYRGGGESQVIYRSRSAMHLIFDTVDRPNIAELATAEDWFAFERMIGVLLEDHLGYTILERAVRGRGDAGIDIVAIKTTRIVNELWLVQCKHYGPDNPVGPSVIRELLGSMTDITPDDGQAIRGMLVTTSRFTPEALKLAAKHGIQHMDGEDLASICAAINREASFSLRPAPNHPSA